MSAADSIGGSHRSSTRVTVQDEVAKNALVAGPLGREWVAFAADAVLEIFPSGRPVRVPRTPPWVRGVVQRDGRMVTIVDLASFCGMAPVDPLDVCVRVGVPGIAVAFGFERVAHLDAVDGTPVPIIELPLDATWVEESLQIGPRTVHWLDPVPLVAALQAGI